MTLVPGCHPPAPAAATAFGQMWPSSVSTLTTAVSQRGVDGAVVHTAVAPAVKAPLLQHFGIRRVPHMVLLGRDGETLLNSSEFSWDKSGILSAQPSSNVLLQIAARAPAAPATSSAGSVNISIDEDFGHIVPQVQCVAPIAPHL